MANAPQIGEVLLARLPRHLPSGHEQEGTRPVIVVGEPERVGSSRFPQVVVVPVTSQVGAWSQGSGLYLALEAGAGGLTRNSVVMLDHVRGIDAKRIMRRLGRLNQDEYAPIAQSVGTMFGL